jgi:hypothetical protein
MRGLVYLLVCLLLVSSLHRSDAFFKSSDEWLLPGMYVCVCSIQINVLSLCCTPSLHYTTLHSLTFCTARVTSKNHTYAHMSPAVLEAVFRDRHFAFVGKFVLHTHTCTHIHSHIHIHSHTYTPTHTLRRQHQPLHSTHVGVCVE